MKARIVTLKDLQEHGRMDPAYFVENEIGEPFPSEEEECVWCGERRGPDGFEDGLRCKHCQEGDE